MTTDSPYYFGEKDDISIGLSGGRSSGRLLHETLAAYGGSLPPNIRVNFQNTGKEREETLEFLHRIEVDWCVDVNWHEYRPANAFRQSVNIERVNFEMASRNGEPFRMLINYLARYRAEVKNAPPVLPNPVQRLCTGYLKLKVNTRFMKSLGCVEWVRVAGIRADEPDRNDITEDNKMPEHGWAQHPLAEAGITKEQVEAFWREQPFDLRLDPRSDEGNCDLCWAKAFYKRVAIMRKTDRFDEFWTWAEERTGQRFRRNEPSYAQIREMISTDSPKLIQLETASRARDKSIGCICG